MGMFDDILKPATAPSGGMFDDILQPKPPVAPAGPPAAPISGPNLNVQETKPGVPISQPNIDTNGMRKLDLSQTDEYKSNARIQAIANSLRTGEKLPPGPADYIADNFSMGLTRAPSAFLTALIAKAKGDYPEASFGETYRGMDRYSNDRMSRAETNTGPLAPLIGGAAQIPASMAMTPFKAASVVGRNPVASSLKVGAQSAVPGFVEGAAKNAETPGDALRGGALNAAASAVVGAGTDKVLKASPAAQRGAAAEAQAAKGVDPASTKSAASSFYEDMDKAGVRYDASQTAPLYTAMHDMRNASRYSDEGTPELKGYFNSLMSLSRNEMSYTELQNLRSAVADKTRVQDPATRKAAGEMLGHIDSIIHTAPAINPQGLDMAKMHQEASRLWRSSNLASDIDFKAGKAGRMTDAGKDINPDAKMRDDLFNYRERISNNKYNPLNDTQKALLDRAIEGSTGENIKRKAGDFLVSKAPTIGATAGATATLAGITHGNSPGWAAISAITGFPFWAGAHYAGKGLQNSAAGARMQDVNALLRDVTQSPQLAPGAAISRDDLAKILFGQDLARAAPRIGSAVIGDQKQEPQR